MKKTQIIGLGLILLFIFSGIIFIPKLIEPKEEPETVSYDKVEELDYWLVGKESKLNFVKEEVEEEQQVPETIIIPKEKKEESSSVSATLNSINSIAEKKILTEERKNEILKQIYDYDSKSEDVSYTEFVNLIDTNIASFDQRERDLIVKKYMNTFYDSMNDLNSILSVIGYDLEEVVKEYQINVNDKKSIATLPDNYGTVRGFLLEVKDKGFFVNSNGENKGFYIDLDLGNMLDKYRDYISPSLIAYMEFNNYEMNNILVDYNIEEIAKRIQMLEEGMTKDKIYNYVMSDMYVSSITYYYNLLLGLSHDTFVQKGTFKQSVLDEYEKLQGSATLKDIVTKTSLAIKTNNMVYDNKVKGLVSDYVNSKIYTNELNGILENENTYKYKIMTKEELKPVEIKEEVEEESETETEVKEEEKPKEETARPTPRPQVNTQNQTPANTEPENNVEITETQME